MSTVRYTQKEERANSLSHAFGILLAMGGGYFLLQKALVNPDPFAIPGVLIYVIGVISGYVASTWYHAALPGENKEVLRKFDHAAIYLQIAATYTPLCLLVLRNTGYWGWGILSAAWIVALFGIIYCFTGLKEHSNLETISYLILGNLILVALNPFLGALRDMNCMPTCWWLIAGGVFYLVGAGCYSLPKIRYMHSVFHIFCLLGGISHMIAISFII